MIEAIFKYEFMQNAVIISLIASLMCAIAGVISVERRSVMLSGGIAHTAYGGVGLGYLLGFEPLLGAAIFGKLRYTLQKALAVVLVHDLYGTCEQLAFIAYGNARTRFAEVYT